MHVQANRLSAKDLDCWPKPYFIALDKVGFCEVDSILCLGYESTENSTTHAKYMLILLQDKSTGKLYYSICQSAFKQIIGNSGFDCLTKSYKSNLYPFARKRCCEINHRLSRVVSNYESLQTLSAAERARCVLLILKVAIKIKETLIVKSYLVWIVTKSYYRKIRTSRDFIWLKRNFI